jgi:hypothetical protein
VRKNIEKVIAAFKAGKAAKGDAKETCSTDGEAIYSYALQIARREDDGSIWILPIEDALKPSGEISATTRSHVRAVSFLLKAEPLEQVAEERMVDVRREERENRACAE